MKEKTVKKLSLKMIRIAQLNASGAQLILGGGPVTTTIPTTSRTTAPSYIPTEPTDPCLSTACPTISCPQGV